MVTTSSFVFQVHQRQTERMRHRSEWFLSDPTGLVTVKCRPDRPSSLGPNQLPAPSPSAAAPGSRLSPSSPRMFTPTLASSARLGRSPSSSPRFMSSSPLATSAPVPVPTSRSPFQSSLGICTALCDIRHLFILTNTQKLALQPSVIISLSLP